MAATPAPRDFVRHPHSWVSFQEFDKAPLPYEPTYSGVKGLVDDVHQGIAESPRRGPLIDTGVPGWLPVEDALKLYKLAYFCDGNILELGTHLGLSTSIMASAIASSRRDAKIATIELDLHCSTLAKRNLQDRSLDGFVRFIIADASSAIAEMRGIKLQFALSFADHSHTYQAVGQACIHLRQLSSAGGFVAFQDYVDVRSTRPKNMDEGSDEYYISCAIEDLPDSELEFAGCYGCCGVFRRVR